MARTFCIFGIVILFATFVLQLLVSISLPFLDSFDIVRVHFNSGTATISQFQDPISELRLGIWAYCVNDVFNGDRTCDHTGHGYSVAVAGPVDGQVANIHSSWTNGLPVHPVATGVIFVALLLSFSTHLTVTLVASLVSFLAALITLIAFAIDIALFTLAKHEIHGLIGVRSNTVAGPGFWITFSCVILLLVAGCTVCFGQRRHPTPTVLPTSSGKKRPFLRK